MLNECLKILRERHDLTQKQAADIINKTPQAYCNYEKGKRYPDVETLIKLADFYSVSIDFLVGHKIQTANSPKHLSEEELELIKKYRALDERGKKAVLRNVDGEYQNIQEKLDKSLQKTIA